MKDPQVWYAAAEIDDVILRSTDNGMTWDSYAAGAQKITGDVIKVSLATCDADENVLFALAVDRPSNPDDKDKFDGLYRSTDRGNGIVASRMLNALVVSGIMS